MVQTVEIRFEELEAIKGAMLVCWGMPCFEVALLQPGSLFAEGFDFSDTSEITEPYLTLRAVTACWLMRDGTKAAGYVFYGCRPNFEIESFAVQDLSMEAPLGWCDGHWLHNPVYPLIERLIPEL